MGCNRRGSGGLISGSGKGGKDLGGRIADEEGEWRRAVARTRWGNAGVRGTGVQTGSVDLVEEDTARVPCASY